MKFKYFSMALAAIALASCSSDDLNIGGEDFKLADDGSQIFATIVEPDDDVTRGGFATQINYNGDGTQKSISQTAMFQEGDQFKMYCSNTWKPQVYAFKQDAKIDGVNGSVFDFAYTEGDNAKYNDNTSTLETREYGVFPAANFAFKDEKRSKLIFTLAPINTYESSSDGYYGPTTTAVEGLTTRKVFGALIPMFGFNQDNKIAFNYMTALIRVQLQGVTEGVHNLVLSQSEKADIAGVTNKFQLNGDFESTEFDATEGAAGTLPVFNRVETDVVAKQTQTIQFSADGSISDYIIYMPIPTGAYDLTKLQLNLDGGANIPLTVATGEYKGKTVGVYAGTWDATKAKNITLGTGTRLTAFQTTPEAATAANLMKINSLLNKYANFGREAIVNVTLTDDITIPKQTEETQVEANKKLFIPELKNDVTLNIEGGSILSDEADAAKKILYIVDKANAGTGKLTINFSAADNTADRTCVKISSTSAQNIELKTTDGAGHTATFAGASFDNAAAKVTLNASFVNAPSITKAAEITVAKDLGVGIDAGASNLIIKDAISGEVTVDGGNVTVEAEAADVIPQIWVKKAATTKLDGADVKIVSGKVTKLIVNKGVTKVAMTGGKIGTLAGEAAADKFADNTNLAVETAGAAEITTVNAVNDATKSTLTFTSTWNAATRASAVTAQANIYTAAQLKAVTDLAGDATLEADITIASDFASIAKNANTNEFHGNAHTISGLTAPLFAAIDDAVDIDNLKLTNVNIVSVDEANGVGAIAPSVAAAVKITNSSVAGTISGHYYVGGLVGKVLTGGALEIGYQAVDASLPEQNAMTAAKVTSDITFTNTKSYGTVGWDEKAATWGQFVGTVTGTGTLVIAENCTGNNKFDKKALKFSYQRTNNGSGTITGYYLGNTTFVGYTDGSGDITYDGKTFKDGWATPVLAVTGDATMQTITAATIYTLENYKELDNATKTTIKGAQAALTNAINKINWSNLTIVSHNKFVANEADVK